MDTVLAHRVTAAVFLVASLAAPSARAQAASDWYHLGNSLVDLSLAGLATGPVDRVWYSSDGGTLYALSTSGKTFETSDFEKWSESQAVAPPASDLSAAGTNLPEPGARLRGFNGQRSTMYAFAAYVYQSESGGASWENRTRYRDSSIIGGNVRDLAVSPRDPQEVTASTTAGVFRSLDGGKSWSGLNEGLPNLPAARLWAVPAGDRGAQIAIGGSLALEWQPGEKQAWRPVENQDVIQDAKLRQVLNLAAVHVAADGRAYEFTPDGMITVYWNDSPSRNLIPNSGKVEQFWVDPSDSRFALAVLGARPENSPPGVPAQHVVHTTNGGVTWDDLTSNLPDVAVHGVAASRQGDAIYVATDAGVFVTRTDVSVQSFPTPWQPVTGLPQAPVTDVHLDPGDTQLWAAVQGFGVYSTLAPHRMGDPRVVSTADLIARAAAPGSLMSVRGAKLTSAQAGSSMVPVLATTDTESQIQIPFEASGNTLSLSLAPASGNRVETQLALANTSPGILVEGDGTPILVDANTGTMLDASNPAHSRARIQIVATGLGRVTPAWPVGTPAPTDNPPKAAATVTAYLNRNPIPATAVLAPGPAGLGFYLVEFELPKLVNSGPAELYLEAGGHTSNPVRVYIEP